MLARQKSDTNLATTAFAFYPELSRIALTLFAAAEPLRTMLRSRHRGAVRRAALLGDEPSPGALISRLVCAEQAADRSALDQALRTLLKVG